MILFDWATGFFLTKKINDQARHIREPEKTMTDTWHTELTQDGDRWSFTLTQNGIWHSGGRNYRSRTAALSAAEWHKSWVERPSIADQLQAAGL